MEVPSFDYLIPPANLCDQWNTDPFRFFKAAAWGARHGYERGYNDARQLWPEPIIDSPPTEADGDEQGWVMRLWDGLWHPMQWDDVNGHPWLHSPRWKPKPPTLQEQAFACLDELAKDEPGYWKGIDTIRRALQQTTKEPKL